MSKLMTHIVAGYPSEKISEALIDIMLELGTQYIEIQIPFSDPIADGPTLMHANTKALEAGMTPTKAMAMMKRVTNKIKAKKLQTKMLFMTYYNIAHAMGVEKFCAEAAAAGAYGFIIPDMPIDEEPQEHFYAAAQKNGLSVLPVVSPITTEERLAFIAKKNPAETVYCMSRNGITGAREDVPVYLEEYIIRVRKFFPKAQIGLGFGVSTKAHVEAFTQYADFAIIGSKVIKLVETEGLAGAKKFLADVLGE